MSKAQILDELRKLTPEERREVRAELALLDGEEWLDEGVLTEREKALILSRLDECDKHPEAFIPWEEAEARLKARYGQ